MGKHWLRRAGTAAVVGLFVLVGYLQFSAGDGDDLSASYIGCRVMAGQAQHLYQHDPVDFSDIGKDAVWADIADQADFYGTPHPYVQTPLWAVGLRPLCMKTNFQAFERVFAGLEMLCFAGSVWLIAWYWTPLLLQPAGMAGVLMLLWFSEPFRYAMTLMQTHILFFTMTVGALILAERRRPGWAGLLLACAAAVKLTPGVLVVYWLLTRRWKAAVSMVVWSGLLAGATVLAVGWPLMAVYLAEVHRISRVLLLAMNNQSLAAWWMGWLYPARAASEMTILPLPFALQMGSTALMVGFTAFGGWIDRRRGMDGGPPLGAMMGVLAATIFAPIAWTHYSIVLVAPLMMLWQENEKTRSRWVWIAMGTMLALSYRPLAVDLLDWQIGRYAVVRGSFYASMLCLGVLGWIGWRNAASASIAADAKSQDADELWAISAD